MCLRPLKFWKSDVKNEATGKMLGFITGYDVKSVTYRDFDRRCVELKNPSHCFNLQPIEVPCGRCPECLRAKKYSWLGRCLAEMETTPVTYFVTLTYDDLHVLPEPDKREVQNFVNRCRKWFKFRYLAVGELGTLSERSHYHLIMFCQKPIEDLAFFKMSKGNPLYTSEILSHCWDYKGHISVGKANGPTIAYTLGYLLTKEKTTCFKMQSQGLGAAYFSSLKDSYIIGNGRGEAVHVALPRYLKEKYGLAFEYDPVRQALLWKNKRAGSSLSEEEYRDFKEYLDTHKLVIH